jgi:pimeloyl-ACP methyl ester carboxylesterase
MRLSDRKHCKKPSASTGLAILEFPRLVTEIALLRASKSLLMSAPKGDGHSVIVIPGFLGDDSYNNTLCKYLCWLGYDARGWNLGRNLGPRDGTIEGLERLVLDTYERSGRKISLIGHSLGGVYAREMARALPDKIRQVVSLGSPITERSDSRKLSAIIFRRLNGPVDPERKQVIKEAPPVPTTAVYSRSDGVVHWKNALQRDGHAECQNIEVYGSHCGLTVNTSVWRLLADRLSQTEENWQPFVALGAQRWMFPFKRCF